MIRKQKIAELEYLRAFAFLAVVLQHAIGHYAYLPGTSLADGVMLGGLLLLAKFAVPMFIFISGMVLFYKYDTPGIPYLSFLGKRFKDILLPYLPWAVLYASIEGDHLAIPWGRWKAFGLDLLTGTASYHLWYVIMTFQLYLLFPLFHSAVLKMNALLRGPRLLAAIAVLGLLYAVLTSQTGLIAQWTASLGIPGMTGFFGEYGDRNFIYFAYYFILGAFAGLHLDAFRELLLRYKRAWLTVFSLLLLGMWYRIVAHFQLQPELHIQYNDTLLVQPIMAVVLILSLPAMYLVALGFHEVASTKLQKAATFIGSYSYTAYLAHALMLTAAVKLTDPLLFFLNPTLRTVVAAVLCSILSLITAYVLRRAYRALSGRRTPSIRTEASV